MSFEDMMSQFKIRSEEKISDLRRVTGRAAAVVTPPGALSRAEPAARGLFRRIMKEISAQKRRGMFSCAAF